MTNNSQTSVAASVSTLSTSPNSRPIFQRTIKLNSLQAKRIIDRSYKKLRHALFQTSVIMKITYSEEESAAIDATIDKNLDKEQQAINDEKARIQQILLDNGITNLATYTHPQEFTLEVDSPRASRFLKLVVEADELIGLIDTVWLCGEIKDNQKKDATFKLQQRLIKSAAQIISLESRTRAAAHRRGAGDLVNAAAPQEEIGELDQELDQEIALERVNGIEADTRAEEKSVKKIGKLITSEALSA